METEILIVHLNGEEILRNCLKSIYKDNKKSNIHVLLNNSTDKSEEMLEKEFPKIRITKSNKLLGFAQASNILAKKSKAKYIVFLNNDLIVEKNWLKELLTTIKKHENCVVCQAKILSYKERNKFEYAGAAGGFIDKYGYPFCRGRIFGSIEFDKGQYNDERRIFWGCGVCILINREFFINYGMFDERLYMYSEELDFCWRANIYGKEVWYSPKSTIYHIGNFSTNSYTMDINNLKKDYWITRNHLIVLLKNYSLSSLIKILPARIILESVAAVRFMPIRTFSFIKSLITIPLYHLPYIAGKRKEIGSNRKVKDSDLNKLISNESIVFSHFLQGKNKFTELKIKNG